MPTQHLRGPQPVEAQEPMGAQEAGRTAATDYRAIFDAVSDAILIHDVATGDILDVNQRMCEMFGYSREDARRLNVADLGGGEPRCTSETWKRLMEKTEGGESQTREWQAMARDGRRFWTEVNLKRFVLGGEERVLASIRDISRRKQAEDDLKESEVRFRLITEGSLAGVYIIQDRKFVYLNPTMAQIFGYEVEEILNGQPEPQALVHPDDLPMVRENIRKRLEGEEKAVQYTFRGRRRDGALIYCQVLGSSIEYQGRPVIMGTLLDISDRVQAEEALRAQKNLLNTVFSATPELLVLKDRNFVYQAVNPAFCRLLAKEEAEIIGKTDFDLFPREDAERYRRDDERVLAEDATLLQDEEVTGAAGKKWLQVTKTPVRNEQGAPVGILGSVTDISWRKEAEAALQASEANYRTIFNAANDAIVLMDIDTGNFLDVNNKWCEMTGYTAEEARGLEMTALFLDDVPGHTAEEALQRIRKATREGPQLFEWPGKAKDGRRFWAEVNLTRTVINGRDRLLTVMRDISERKRTEEVMRQSEAKYRNLVEQIPAITYIAALDNVTSPIYISPQIETVLGLSQEEWLANPESFKERIHPEDRNRVLSELILSYSQGGPFLSEYRMVAKTGRVVWVRDESRAVYDAQGLPLFMQGVALDITARKEAEEALREANSKLQALVQASPLAITAIDADARVISWNPAAERIFGWHRGEVLGRPYPIVPEQKKKEFRKIFQRVLRGETIRGLELRRQRKDGSPVDINLSTAPLYNAAGNIAGVMGVIEDITARKRTEEALRESEVRFRGVFEGAGIGIALVNLDRRILESNRALLKMGGYSEEEMRRITAVDITHPDDWAADLTLFTELVAGKRNHYQMEKRYRHKKGHWVWVRLSVTLVRDAAGQPQFAISMVEDITERRRMEEALWKVSRALKAITECHQAMMRASNETELLNEVCRIIVEVGGYLMAWVGFAQQDELKTVRPVAQEGFDAGYVHTVKLTWADTEMGQGPVGAAIRQGKPAICRDTGTDPKVRPLAGRGPEAGVRLLAGPAPEGLPNLWGPGHLRLGAQRL